MNDAWINIRKSMGKSGGFAIKETERFSVFLESENDKHCLDNWQCGGYGYSSESYALDVAQPFIDLLNIPVKYTELREIKTETKYEEIELNRTGE